MCVTNAEEQELPRQGDTVILRGKSFIVEGSEYQYFETNGDSSARYITMRAADGTPYIITHKAYFEKVEALKEVFITPAQILRDNPCREGAQELFSYLGIGMATNDFTTGANLAASGKLSEAISIRKWYNEKHGAVPTSWLIFLAKALGKIPKESNMRKMPVLLRLLGIK